MIKLLIVKLICKECYIKKYGEMSNRVVPYQITNEKMECEDCGKKDCLIYTTEAVDPKNYNLKLNEKTE